MEIDNFDIVKKHLTFIDQYDRYVINILRRQKDIKSDLGSNESQRLLRTYYINDLDYLDRKIPAIKELCTTNNARAYILPQVRNNRDCLINLGKIVFENLDNPTIKLDSIVRKAVCSLHHSRAKRWILDLDDDNMIEYIDSKENIEIIKKNWKPERVLMFIKKSLADINADPNDAYILKTKNGHCIVTPPFDLQKAFKKCNMMFQGGAKKKIGVLYTGPGEYEDVFNNVNGWLIKDGMALLYLNDGRK